MNSAILAVLTVTLSGNVQISVTINEAAIHETWKDTVETAGVPADFAKIKKIRFVPQMSWWTRLRSGTTAKKANRYVAGYISPISEIEFYVNNFRKRFWRYEKCFNFSAGDVEASFHYTLAHEMLHHIFEISGVPRREQHVCMEEGKYLTAVMNRIDARLFPTGTAAPTARWLAINSLREGIRLDQLQYN